MPQNKQRDRPRSKHEKRKAPLEDLLPIEKVEHGIVYTKDGRYIKVLEVAPINFLMRSAREQRNLLYSFISYLKVCPVKGQIKVLSKKSDISRHIRRMKEQRAKEQNPHCAALQDDYIQMVQEIGSREAVTRRFFLAFQYEPFNNRLASESDAISSLQAVANTAANYFRQCGSEVIEHANEDEAQVEIFYTLYQRCTSQTVPLASRAAQVVGAYMVDGHEEQLNDIPLGKFLAPPSFSVHSRYIVVDGQYQSYHIIPGDGYKSKVFAGWLAPLVNAGEGVDLDIYWTKEPKDRIIQKLGQQLRINRSKIKDASDTNTDFDDLENAIGAGYYLKNGLANNEDFFYVSTLITISGQTEEEMEWRINEVRKLLASQDTQMTPCYFRQEQAFLSALPLVALDKQLGEMSRRNMLTSGFASFFPFISYEISDENGIFIGINKTNNSLIIMDPFDSAVYKNAGIAILGCTGAGKTFLSQCFALRYRRRGVPTYIIAPLKGHEFRRACTNVGGAFISIGASSPWCINALEIRRIDHTANRLLDGDDGIGSLLAAKIQQLHIFFSLLIPDMSYEERQLLDDAMVQTYASYGITHDNDSLEDPHAPGRYRPMPILGDLYQILLEGDNTKRLANILNRLVHGSARSFNQRTNVDLDNPYTVLDLSNLSGDLLPAGMFLALDYVWDMIQADRTQEKMVLIDECWQLIGASSNRQAADFVLRTAKIARGYGASPVFATQDINDFFALDDGKYGKGIINACAIKVVLGLEDDEARRVANVLNLSELETMAITHFERGNGLICSNNNTVAVQFKASPLETELITTDRRELAKILKRKQETSL
mgnify:CR=1 FL=1|jgi:conjugal transfer ATP-binding protein TraC